MTKQEYAEYQQSVADFMTREGITNLSAISAEEPHFSWSSCDCCGSPLGGDREYTSGYNPTTKEVCGPYSVCEDCIYYAEYGRLDDMTMAEVEDSRRAQVAEMASQALWQAVALGYPEVKSGDMTPEASIALGQAIESAIQVWLDLNRS